MSAPRTQAMLEVGYPGEGTRVIDDIKGFRYSSDVLAVGDQCTFDVVNDRRGTTLRQLRVGSTVRLWLKNAAVNGGAWTLKHLGLITDRDASCAAGVIKVTSADLGWHLHRGCAPLWKQLRRAVFGDLVDPTALHTILDPSWGLQGVRIDDNNLLQRRIKLGVQAVRAHMGSSYEQVFHVQVEPGDTYFDVLSKYAQRFNRLVNVTCDGFIQVWNPDYKREPAYHFRCDDTASNIADARMKDSIETVYTDVVCVGQVIGSMYSQQSDSDPNAGLFRGAFHNTDALPFRRRLTFADSEMWRRDYATKQAEWRYKRGIYDSHYVQIDVPDHYQMTGSQGTWYESDQLAGLHIPELGITDSRYYIASVVCDSDDRGDRTTIVARLPEVLSASFDPKSQSKSFWQLPSPSTAPDVPQRLRRTGAE